MSDAGRRSIRLREYDYASEGAYFVTICAAKRACIFGQVDGEGVMQLSAFGEIVHEEWLRTPEIRGEVEIDEFVVMPNHFHAIVFIVGTNDDAKPMVDGITQHGGDPVGARRAVPLQPPRAFGKPIAKSLPTIIGAFKSAVTKRINESRDTPGDPVWQRNYHEHVIRNESSLNDIRLYIQTNPACWAEDSENPANVTMHNERV